MPTAKDGQESECPQPRIVRNLNTRGHRGTATLQESLLLGCLQGLSDESECPQTQLLFVRRSEGPCTWQVRTTRARPLQESECPQPRIVRNLNAHSQGLSGI